MRIRNKMAYPLYLPYAGVRKGTWVEAGKLSREIPPERFHDSLLQRDWQIGKIEVFIGEVDRAALGPFIEGLKAEVVRVDGDDVVEEAAPAPEPEQGPEIEPESTDEPEQPEAPQAAEKLAPGPVSRPRVPLETDEPSLDDLVRENQALEK